MIYLSQKEEQTNKGAVKMEMLKTKINERAAQIVHESYGTVTKEDAFYMAVGEAEVEFDCDIDVKYEGNH